MLPSYSFEAADLRRTVYGTISIVDYRRDEPENVNRLAACEKIDPEVFVRVNDAFVVQVAADNITDEDVLTESDARTLTGANGASRVPDPSRSLKSDD